MNKITLDDFSGGLLELTAAEDFTPKQWSQLKGFVPASSQVMESQWPVQTVGTTGNTDMVAVFPLTCEQGMVLTAIKSDGTLWYCVAPAHDATYSTANAIIWTQITTVKNTGWVEGNSATQTVPTLISNPELRFICGLAVEAHKYIREPYAGESAKPADKDNPSKDVDDTNYSGSSVFSAVLLNTSQTHNDDKNTQQVVLFIDTNDSPLTVKALTFPNYRRFPTRTFTDEDGNDTGDFINAVFLDNDNVQELGSFPEWPTNMAQLDAPEVYMHPYNWVDFNASLRPGRGIIPRANVGCMKNDLLILGDIEWRKDNYSPENVVDVDISTLVGVAAAKVVIPKTKLSSFDNRVAPTLYNNGPGTVYFRSSDTVTTGFEANVTNRKRLSNVATLTLDDIGTLAVSDTIKVTKCGGKFNGTYTLTAVDSGLKTVTYANTGPDITDKPKSAVIFAAAEWAIQAEIGQTVSIPREWGLEIWAKSSVAGTKLIYRPNVDLAYHYLNDTSTKSYKFGLYYSEQDIDEFDPRSFIAIGKSDSRIAGMHTIDDTVIVVTTAGGEGDGVYRLRGYFSQLHPYNNTAANPNAIRLELIRGGIGAPQRTLTGGHKNYSCLWKATNTVVFLDRLGGIFYTNGNVVDRIDRTGPLKPNVAVEEDHVAEVGEHLLVYRDSRLLCFSLLGTDNDTGLGAWTELVAPAGTIKSMIGSREDLYFVNDNKVKRYATAGPAAERGKIDNVLQTLTLGTPTVGSQDEHDRSNWHNFGMTFTTPTSCDIKTVQIQSTGSLNTVGGVSLPVVAHTLTLDRTFDTPAVLGEFVVPAGIGPQQAVSATVTFTGYIRLESASFWFTSRTPRRGDL